MKNTNDPIDLVEPAGERVPLDIYDTPPPAKKPVKPNGHDPRDEAAAKRFPLIAFDDIKMSSDGLYLVKGLIPSTGLVVVWGAPKCGKSFWVYDLVMHVALGRNYRGLRVKQGAVVYCALEGQRGFRCRVEAFRLKNPDAKGAPFHFMPRSLNLIKDHSALIAAIRAQLAAGVIPAAIVIDTLNRSLFGSEISDEDMAAYVRGAQALIDAFDCAVIIIHHCGHNEARPRGHSSLLGSLDELIGVKKNDAGHIVALHEESKDGETGAEFVSVLTPVEVGKDEAAAPIFSRVIEAVGGEARQASAATAKTKSARQKLTARQTLAYDALVRLCLASEELAPPMFQVPNSVRVVKADAWLAEVLRGPMGDIEKPLVRFTEVRTALAARGSIGDRDNLVWPAL